MEERLEKLLERPPVYTKEKGKDTELDNNPSEKTLRPAL